jgi:hypothetical protein
MILTRQRLNGNIPRYIKQRDKFRCGPVAVINYWKAIGLGATYYDIKSLSKILKTESVGTFQDNLERIIGVKFRQGKWGEFKRHLLKSKTVILSYGDHYYFIPCFLMKDNKINHVLVVNDGCTYSTITIKKVKSLLSRSEMLLCPEKRL